MKNKCCMVALALAVCLLCGCTPAPEETEKPTQDMEQSESSSESESKSTDKNTEKATQASAQKAPWEEDGMLKILTIGNSFSDDTMEYIYQIAQSAGVENIKLGNLYIGGCSVDSHVANAEGDVGAYEYRTNTNGTWSTTYNYKMGDALESENWDFISLQQASGYSGKAESYAKVPLLVSYVRDLAGDKPVLVWNMTWAYAQSSDHSDFPKYNSDQMTMYRAIVDTVEDQIETNKSFSLISPAGTAIQNARTSYIGDSLTRDGYHLTFDLGRYISGLTMFHTLTGISIENLKYKPAGVDEDAQMVAIESAMNAVKQPKSVTNSKYSTLPELDLSKYTKLEIDWNIHSYWNSGAGSELTSGTNNFTKQYCATAKFSKTDIPVGSVIVIAEGWQYRPEGWSYSGSRPNNVSTSRVTVSEAWWGSYTTRAFNISSVLANGNGDAALNDITAEALNEVFTIYIPKN